MVLRKVQMNFYAKRFHIFGSNTFSILIVVRFLFKTEFPLTVQPIKNHAHNVPYVDIKSNQNRAFDIQALQSMVKALFPKAHLLIFSQFAETHFYFRLGTIKTEFSVQTSQSMEKTLFPKAHLLICFQFAGTYFCFKLCLIKTEFGVQASQSMVKALFPKAHLLICFQFAETHFCFKFNTIKTEPSVHREPAKGGKAFIIQRIPFAFSPSSEIYFLLKRTLCNFCPMPRINGRQRFDAAYADQTACISAGKCKVFHPFQFTPQKVNRLLCSCDLFLRFRPFHRQKSSAHL